MTVGPAALSAESIYKLLSKRERKIVSEKSFKPSAVFIPMFLRDEKYYLLFTRRSYKVSSHKGQISFPGGGFHPDEDDSLMDTALRETDEEVGIRRSDIRLLGALDDLLTHSSGFIITPFVGIFPYPYNFVVSDFEIESLIEVPLGSLLDEANYREEVWVLQGEPYHAHLYRYGDDIIWGATARILSHFLELLRTIIPGGEQDI